MKAVFFYVVSLKLRNFDKWRSDVHFVSFLLYYYCNNFFIFDSCIKLFFARLILFFEEVSKSNGTFCCSLYALLLCHKKGVWAKNCSSHPFSMIRTVGNGCGRKGKCPLPLPFQDSDITKSKTFFIRRLPNCSSPLLTLLCQEGGPFWIGFLGFGPTPPHSRAIRRKRFPIHLAWNYLGFLQSISSLTILLCTLI